MKGTRQLRGGSRRSILRAAAFVMVVCMVCTCIPQTVKAASSDSKVQERIFVHPGMLHTAESFTAMQANVGEKVQPAYDTWNALKSNGFSDANWAGRPLETVIRGGTGQNVAQLYIDIRRAYQTALVWKVGGSEAHGEAACRILNKWSSTMKTLTGNADRFLASGIYGYELANAAEIMRDYPDFDKASMEKLFLEVFYPMQDDFLKNHNTAHFGNYWANWDLCNIAGMMAIGIFTDREDIYNQAIDYYKNGIGNGCLYNAMPYVFEEGLSQWQEAGRDQGHTTLGVSLCSVICEMAWNQGDDLYSLSDNRFLKGAEYVAKFNNNEEVPFERYQRFSGQSGSIEWNEEISEAGRPSVRPVYSLVYNHYVNRMGLSAPNIEKALKNEDGSWKKESEQANGDELGWQTLTFAGTGKKSTGKKTQGAFADGVYRIRSVLTNKSLVPNGSAQLASAESGTKSSEWWRFENLGDGDYIITNTETGEVIQTGDDLYAQGTVFETADRTNALNQRFAFLSLGDGVYRIISTINSHAIDIMNGKTEDATPIIQWKYNGNTCQKWIIETRAQAGLPDLEEPISEKILAQFDFDNETDGFTSENAKAAGTYTLQDSYHRQVKKALYLDGTANQFLTVTNNNGGSLLTGCRELTVSFESRPDRTDTNWLFYAAPNTDMQKWKTEKYLGIMQNDGTLTAERYYNNGARPQNASSHVESEWAHIDVVFHTDKTEIYVNGVKQSEEESTYKLADILGTDSVIQIGKANWGTGEYYKGWIDNLIIRNYAMDADAITKQADKFLKLSELPEVLADFSFDTDGAYFDGGNAKAAGTYTLETHGAGKALKLNGDGQHLVVTDKNNHSLLTGLDEVTVSYQIKPESSRTNWGFFAAPNTNKQEYKQEHYIGIVDISGTTNAERYNNNGERPTSARYETGYNGWYYVTAVYAEGFTTLYINGEKVAEAVSDYALSDILGDNSILYIGKSTWGNDGEYAAALIDNYKIVSSALTAEEVAAEAAKYVENKPVLPYEDVAESDWFYDGVYYNYFAKTMTGKDNAHFAPFENLTRAQFAVIVHRMSGEPEVEYQPTFPDVEDHVWYTNAILWASGTGIVNGYEDSGLFGHSDKISREQMAVILYRYAKYLKYDTGKTAELDSFEDAASVSKFAKEAMRWAVGNRIITGKYEGTRLDPQGNVLRAECAVMIQRFREVHEK